MYISPFSFFGCSKTNTSSAGKEPRTHLVQNVSLWAFAGEFHIGSLSPMVRWEKYPSSLFQLLQLTLYFFQLLAPKLKPQWGLHLVV
mmetsp:Transcript_87349/g.144615  ORF Transcript_87349/g.144615 Transcript_87349/m.144615 type:complete len:87 (+) Transcript_87349:1-261(+)